MCKHALLLCAIGVLTGACAAGPRIDAHVRVSIDGGSPVDVPLSLSAERASQQARWTEAIAAAVRHHVRILGTPSAGTIRIVDRDVGAPLWSSHRGMAVEAAVARSVAASFWSDAIPCGADRRWFVDGLARYTSIAAVAAQNQGARESAFVGTFEARYAGGLLPWVISTSVPAWTAGSGVTALRAQPGIVPGPAASAIRRDAVEMRVALAMATLSNWVGGPTWDAVLQSFVDAARGHCASWQDLRATAAEVTGLDLSWLFDQVFASDRVFDYGVEELTSVRADGAAQRYRTSLVVRRYGDAAFTGTSEPPLEPFESGRGVEIAVRFADGAERLERWDGRAASRRFTWESGTPVQSATVDPRQVMLLDINRTNNSRTLTPRVAATAARWSVVWAVWLEHLLLSYGSLV